MDPDAELFVVHDVFKLMNKKNVVLARDGGPYSIVMAPLAMYFVKTPPPGTPLAQLIQTKAFLKEVLLSDVQDILFPSLESLMRKYANGPPDFCFRIVTASFPNELTPYTSKEAFFKFRDFLRQVTQKKVAQSQNNLIVLEPSLQSQACLNFLNDNPSSYAMFEKLVLQSRVLTLDEFFKGVEPLRARLESFGLKQEVVDRLVSFRAFEKIRFEDRDVVQFRKADRDTLLASFTQLRELYERQCFGVFGDRLEEELAFWDDIMRQMKEEKCYLYGTSLDGKEVAVNKPTFLGLPEADLAEDPLAKFHVDFAEPEVTDKTSRVLKVGNVDSSTLIQKVNNQSATILHRGTDVAVRKQWRTPHKIEVDFSEFEIDISAAKAQPLGTTPRKSGGAMDIEEPTPRLPRRNSRSGKGHSPGPAHHQPTRHSHDKTNGDGHHHPPSHADQEFMARYRLAMADTQRSIQKRLSEDLPYQLFKTPSPMVIEAINNNRNDNLSLGDPRGAYFDHSMDSTVEARYRLLNDMAAKLLRKLFRMYPLDNSNERVMRDKLVAEIKALAGQIDAYEAELKSNTTARLDDRKRNQGPLIFLSRKLKEAVQTVSSQN